jgi:hypothetical protein
MNLKTEFNRQVSTLLDKGYPATAGISEDQFRQELLPLAALLEQVPTFEPDTLNGRLPFVIVINSARLPTDKAMALVEREGKPGVTKLYPRLPQDFQTTGDADIPNGMAYLLCDIDRGAESLNLAPQEALPLIKKAGRSPLTIDEGVALVSHYPDFLRKNNCFSLLASRYPADKRVPAIWINAQKNPNLGWCWDGNPHTWLGSASCGSRLGL